MTPIQSKRIAKITPEILAAYITWRATVPSPSPSLFVNSGGLVGGTCRDRHALGGTVAGSRVCPSVQSALLARSDGDMLELARALDVENV